jgi:uncharacterized protein YqgC (DUF456 family)
VIKLDILYWLIISVSFLLSFVGLVWPIIPGMLFLLLGFLLYGWFFTFEPLTFVFWLIQITLIILLFITDYFSNLFGVKKLGGTKAAIWGSTIGLLIGPFVIPVAGIIIGPFLGAVIAELIIEKKPIASAFKVGIGSVLGFLSGSLAKFFIQAFMIGYFLFKVLY